MQGQLLDLYVRGGESQVAIVMDEQGGSRAGDQIFALRQVAKNNREGMLLAHISLCFLYA